MTVNHPHPMFRTGTRRYTKRPPANCRKARRAWDEFAADGPVVWIQLLDGYWGCMRESGNIEEIENLPYLAERRNKTDDRHQYRILPQRSGVHARRGAADIPRHQGQRCRPGSRRATTRGSRPQEDAHED